MQRRGLTHLNFLCIAPLPHAASRYGLRGAVACMRCRVTMRSHVASRGGLGGAAKLHHKASSAWQSA